MSRYPSLGIAELAASKIVTTDDLTTAVELNHGHGENVAKRYLSYAAVSTMTAVDTCETPSQSRKT